MERIDGRELSSEALEERWHTIIRMKENGFTEKQIVAATGCSRQTISPLWNRYIKSTKKTKENVLKVKRRNRKRKYKKYW